jgi:hypothetical protein
MMISSRRDEAKGVVAAEADAIEIMLSCAK